MKVYSGAGHIRGQGKQRRFVVAAKSRAAALRALVAHGVDVSASRMASHWIETGNAEQIALASTAPERVFATESTNYPHVYKMLDAPASEGKAASSSK